jgi:ABC-2 type transport system ATP-binding protein
VNERAPLLQVAGLTKAYGSHVVLDDVALTLEGRRAVAVTGPNGAGKSTLLGCVADTLRHAGSVMLDGKPLSAGAGRLAYLPQRVRMPPTATIGQIIALFRSLAAGQAQRIEIPVDFLPDPERRIGQLSGGQAQRVALAAALSGSPDLVLLDEPFANLDEAGREMAVDLVRRHAAAGALVLIASPTVLDLIGAVEQVVHVADGGVRFVGSVGDYLGRLTMTIWIERNGVPSLALDALGDELTVRHVAGWTAIDTEQQLAAGVIAALADRGVSPERIMIADRLANGRSSPPVRDGGE